MKDELKTLSEAVKDGDEKKSVELVKQALEQGISAIDILNDGLIPGVQALGALFKDGQAFLPEVLISVRALNYGIEIIQPQLSEEDLSNKGTVVLGTVEGDIHDIGKNLVGMMLKSAGFNVIDIGVDRQADFFVAAIQEYNADIVAVSGLLTTTIPYFSDIIDAMKEAGLRDSVKVMVGGAPVTPEYAGEIGADGFAPDCVSAVDEAVRLMALA